MADSFVIVRSLHVLFAVLWAGASFHYALVSKKAMESEGGLPRFLAESKHGPFMGLTATAAVGFGLATYLINGADAYTSTENMILGIGMLGAVLGLVVGWGGHLPTSIKMKGALAAGDDGRIAALVRKEHNLQILSMVGIGVALVTMVTFRWF